MDIFLRGGVLKQPLNGLLFSKNLFIARQVNNLFQDLIFISEYNQTYHTHTDCYYCLENSVLTVLLTPLYQHQAPSPYLSDVVYECS